MRKNTTNVIHAWVMGRQLGGNADSIWTDGYAIYSYRTCLLEKVATYADKPATYAFNDTFYSRTTSNKQNSIKQCFNDSANALEGTLVAVNQLPRGVGPLELKERALQALQGAEGTAS